MWGERRISFTWLQGISKVSKDMIHIGVRSFICFSGQIEVKSVVEKGCIQNQLFWFNRFHIFEDSKGFFLTVSDVPQNAFCLVFKISGQYPAIYHKDSSVVISVRP